MFDIFKSRYKRFFFMAETSYAVIISVILHLSVICLVLMQFTSEKKANIDNFVVTNLIDINEINNLLNKDLDHKESQLKTPENKNQSDVTLKNPEVVKPVLKKESQKAQIKKKVNSVANTKKTEKIDAKPKLADKILNKQEENLVEINSKKNITQAVINSEIDKKISYYSQLIQQEIAKNWKKPYAFNVSQPAIVRIKLSREGDVVDINLLSSSNNKLYDESILQAITDSSPIESIKKMDMKTFIKNFTIIKLCFRPEDLD